MENLAAQTKEIEKQMPNGAHHLFEKIAVKYAAVEAKTGGGRHLFFLHPGGTVKNSAGRLGPGLDVRGDGGYIVAPPSIHPSGRPYIWLPGRAPNETPLAAAPAWLLHRIREPVGSKPAPRGNGNPGIGTTYAQAALARAVG